MQANVRGSRGIRRIVFHAIHDSKVLQKRIMSHNAQSPYSDTVLLLLWQPTLPTTALTCEFAKVIGHVKPSVVGPTVLHVDELHRPCKAGEAQAQEVVGSQSFAA